MQLPEIPEAANGTPDGLTPAVLMAAEMLGLYRAELARILGLKCEQIGALANARSLLEPGSLAWVRASDFVRLYQALYRRFGGAETGMCHWLRVVHPALGTTPLLAMVDEGRLDAVLKLAS